METITNSCGVFVVLEYLQQDFLIGNIHLRTGKSRDDVRIPQLKSCFKIINKYNINTFITGDFNDGLRPEYSTTNFVLENNFKIIFLPLDHIITNNFNIIVKKGDEMVPIPNELEPSDHLPLIFFVEFI